jgi:Flp pilus assembly protein TadG
MMRRRLATADGQSLVEFALFFPIALVLCFGLIELGYALLDQHTVSKMTREGSNLISRSVTIEDASTTMQAMGTGSVSFSNGSTLIFSVLRKVATTNAANFDRVILYQRHSFGDLPATSTFSTAGFGSFDGPPDYQAFNSDTDTALRITNLPASLNIERGGVVYVTEIFTAHELITPFNYLWRPGRVPTTLYSVAYF